MDIIDTTEKCKRAVINSAELRYLSERTTEEQFREELRNCGDPKLAAVTEDDYGWLVYKAAIFEAIARGCLQILQDPPAAKRSLADEVFDTAVSINRIAAEQIREGGGLHG